MIDADGDPIHFTANAAKNGWVPEPGSEDLTLTGNVAGSFTLSDTDGSVTEFTKIDPAVETWQVTSTLLNGLANTTTTVVSEAVTVGGAKLVRPKRVIAATPAVSAAACTAAASMKGCRVLDFVYADSTTATALTFGDYANQVKEIRLWSTEPGAGSATSKTVQAYAYDSGGKLRQTWNPLITPSLKTEYGYDSAGRVTSLTRGSSRERPTSWRAPRPPRSSTTSR